MSKLLRGLQRWRERRRLENGTAALSARLAALDERAQQRLQQMRVIETRLRSISEELMGDWEAERAERGVIQTELRELQRKFDTYATEIDRLRAQKGVSDETIKNLVAGYKLLQETLDTETAMQIKRQVMDGPA